MAIGVWPLVPKVTVDCPPVTPAAASQSCTVTVVNPPLSGYTIKLTPKPGEVDPTSSCLTGVSFTGTQTTQTCVMKIDPAVTNPAVVKADAAPDPTGLAGWTIVDGFVNLAPGGTPPVNPGAAQPVPANSPLALLLTALGLVGLTGLVRIRKS